MEAKKKCTPFDFKFLQVLGRGAYGRVLLAEKKDSGGMYAVKIVDKALLKKENKVKQALAEKNILAKLKDHPGIVSLHYTFQDEESLYFALEYCTNGEFLGLIRALGQFTHDLAQFYAAELVNILEYMHGQGVMHRDLKPENLLLAQDNHLRLTDFGTAKDLEERSDTVSEEKRTQRRGTFVGTAEYVSPEILADAGAGPAVDLWALGCIIFQMYTGRPPFRAQTDFLIFERIREGIIEFPPEVPEVAVDLIQKLLKKESEQRLGAGPRGGSNDYTALKAHPYFQGIDIDNIFNMPVPEFERPAQPSRKGSDDDLEIDLMNRKHEPKIIKTGLVKKKSPYIFYNTRQLVISSEPRISYYDPNKNEYKGDIEISSQVRALVKGSNEFHIATPKRTYVFKTILGTPAEWVDTVNKLVSDHFHD